MMVDVEERSENRAASDSESVVESNTKFGLNLYKRLQEEDENIFVSPYSISTALAMTYSGTRGTTEEEMGQTLQFTLEQDRTHAALASISTKLEVFSFWEKCITP